MAAVDTVPVTFETKQRVKELQSKVAQLKGVTRISQQDLMDTMTVDYLKLVDNQLVMKK